MDIKKQLEDFKQIVKAPPIHNPREEEFADRSNDDLDMADLERLFEEVADPIIQRNAERKRDWANIPIKDLKMSEDKALAAAKELYADKGYPSIFLSGDTIAFKLSGQ
tara:strand:+ start:496 stop:819 length:324 start_codon:yes stop_codon:yes gene_type:complete